MQPCGSRYQTKHHFWPCFENQWQPCMAQRKRHYEQEKVHELSFSYPDSEFIPSMCCLYWACGEAPIWLHLLERRQGHVPKSQSPLGRAVATKSSTSPYRSTACAGQWFCWYELTQYGKNVWLCRVIFDVLMKSQVVSNDMLFLSGPRRRHYMPRNKKRFGCKSPWSNPLASRRNRAWTAHESQLDAKETSKFLVKKLCNL